MESKNRQSENSVKNTNANDPPVSDLASESRKLRSAWERFDSEHLQHYLVSDVQNPRINIQSIITRAFIIDSLWPNEFTTMIQQEILFGACMNFILSTLKDKTLNINRQFLLNALTANEKIKNLPIPEYFTESFIQLSSKRSDIPNYITAALTDRLSDDNCPLPESALSAFQNLWHVILNQKEPQTISILEPACGSANDYRFFHSFGLARFLDYTGIDIAPKNIANARRFFPDINFKNADILNIPADHNSYDYTIAFDIFEHLSPVALEIALSEVAKVTRKQACLSFFNMAHIDEHIIKPTDLYYWNTLSLNKIKQQLSQTAIDIDVIHIDSHLKENYNCHHCDNKNAYIFFITFSTS